METSQLKANSMSQPTSSDHICVTAIDFGTTYSGWACSLKADFASDQTRIHLKQWSGDRMITTKCPTCILLKNKPGNTFETVPPEADAETSIDSERTLVKDTDEPDAEPKLSSHGKCGTWKFGITPSKNTENEIQGKERNGGSPVFSVEEDEIDFVAFGYEAERQYTELVTSGDAGDYFIFKQFKMLLYEKKNMPRDIALKATNGKTLPALLVSQK